MGILAQNFNIVLPLFPIKNNPRPSDFTLHQGRFISRRNHCFKFKRTLVMAQNPATVQQLTVLNKHGEKLVRILHETGSMEIVVLCRGFRSSKARMDTMCYRMAPLPCRRPKSHLSDHSPPEFRFILKRWRNRFIIPLQSNLGGNVVLLYASKYHDIHAVVNVSGRYDLKKGIEERLGKDFLERITKDGFIDVKGSTGEVNYRVTKESLMDRLNTNMHEACLSIDERCRLLTVHGSTDEIIPVEDALAFAKIIPNHRLHIIEGAVHRYSSHQAELASVVLPFVKECLQFAKDAPK
ncbi:alpha/beta-Hydrolases superfamily protein [Abeliophyllum distichum]|uniref:Alpha/beta-Hydrolases superfamily protein n=1 Tax=Abeliophyllum distichum TaxID=126358 RepID=A0ABD1NVW9_9LAMI